MSLAIHKNPELGIWFNLIQHLMIVKHVLYTYNGSLTKSWPLIFHVFIFSLSISPILSSFSLMTSLESMLQSIVLLQSLQLTITIITLKTSRIPFSFLLPSSLQKQLDHPPFLWLHQSSWRESCNWVEKHISFLRLL